MAKVVVKKFNDATAREIGAKKAAVKTKYVRDDEGRKTSLMTLDAGSQSFGSDLTYAFGKNVAKARRDNKRITGSLDRVPAKR